MERSSLINLVVSKSVMNQRSKHKSSVQGNIFIMTINIKQISVLLCLVQILFFELTPHVFLSSSNNTVLWYNNIVLISFVRSFLFYIIHIFSFLSSSHPFQSWQSSFGRTVVLFKASLQLWSNILNEVWLYMLLLKPKIQQMWLTFTVD